MGRGGGGAGGTQCNAGMGIQIMDLDQYLTFLNDTKNEEKIFF